MSVNFGSKLATAFEEFGQLCVGVDPHPKLMLDWGYEDSVQDLERFSMTVLDAAINRVGIIKPQVSFYERYGSRGFAVLEKLAVAAENQKLVVIMDAKRGDIGTTMAAYYDAWLGKNAPFICDALTVSPYLGFESLSQVMSDSLERGKGIFTLAATSNPEGASLQKATLGGQTIAASIWQSLQQLNQTTHGGRSRFGSFGAVIGATLNLNAYGLGDVSLGQPQAATPILAPGFGAQGAELTDSRTLFGAAADQVIHSVSRSILQAGAKGLEKAIDAAKVELARGLG